MKELINYPQKHLYLLGALILTLYLAHLGLYPLIDPDEGRYGRISMEMALSNDFITPRIDNLLYFEKPILYYWVTAFFMKIFGIHDFTVRLFPALCGIGNTWLAWRLGKEFFSEKAALLGTIVLSTTISQLIISSMGIMDMPLTFFTDAGLVGYYLYHKTNKTKYIYASYAALAFAVLTKGFIGAILPGGIIVFYALITKQWDMIKKLFHIPAIILFLAISVPWYYAICQVHPEFFQSFIIEQQFLRFLTKMYARYQPWYFFIPVLLGGFLPWIGYAFLVFSKNGQLRTASKTTKKDIIFLLTWFFLVYIFYSLSSSKLVTYILPCWLPLSLFIGSELSAIELKSKKVWVSIFFNTFFILLLLIGGIYYLDHLSFITSISQAILSTWLFILGGLWLGIGTPIIYRNTNDIKKFLTFICVGAFIYAGGVQQIQTIFHTERSTIGISQDIRQIKAKAPDAEIVMYGFFIPGLMYYLNQPVLSTDYIGELDFGIANTPNNHISLPQYELVQQWQAKIPTIVVVKPNQLDLCLEILETPPAQQIQNGEFVLLTNIAK